jgi:cell filamentation protein
MPDRYDTTGSPEDEYYLGTSVFIKVEDIRDSEELLERETELPLAAYKEVFASFDEDLIPDLHYVYHLHQLIFGPLFGWAGRHRTVGISKGGTPFCPPQNIEGMMRTLFAELARERWLSGLGVERFLERAAYYVCEINAVHPFARGTAALSGSTLMCSQRGRAATCSTVR